MSEPRLKSGFWVSMALRSGDRLGRPGVVVRKGDPDAGGVLVVLHGRAGSTVLSQVRDASGEVAWLRGTGPLPVEQPAADAYIARQVGFDPDLWVLEFETQDLTPPFDAKIV
jgi:hypothetical protein